MNTDALHQWLSLEDERRRLEAELKEVVSQQEQLREGLLEAWMQDGVTSVRVNGRTVWLQRQAYAQIVDGDYERAAAALKAAGLESLLRPNLSTLSAYIREREANGESLPPSFAGAVQVFERFNLRARKG